MFSGLPEVLGRTTLTLLIRVIAKEVTMKNTSKKKMTSIMGIISMRTRLTGL
jgi:hypothetical protein